MYNLDEIKEDLKKILSTRRYIHSLGVMEMAGNLAKIYNIDVEKAMVTGLLHDIAKEMKPDKMLKYVKDNNIKIDEIEEKNIPMLHGKIGADIAKKKYKVDDSMKLAIQYHTTTDKNMDLLAKIIYVSDKIELNRDTDKYDIEYERDLAKKDLDATIIYIINDNIKFLIKKDKLIHPKSIETRNYLIMQKNIFKNS